MAITKEDILNAVEQLTVMELNELVKAFEEKFGVSAAAVAVAAAGVHRYRCAVGLRPAAGQSAHGDSRRGGAVRRLRDADRRDAAEPRAGL